MRVVVYHQGYGCDTWCCGHYVELQNDDGIEQEGKFDFSHPYGDTEADYVRDLVTETYGEEHVKDIDWENCIIYGVTML